MSTMPHLRPENYVSRTGCGLSAIDLSPSSHPHFSGVFAAIPGRAAHAPVRENSHDSPVF